MQTLEPRRATDIEMRASLRDAIIEVESLGRLFESNAPRSRRGAARRSAIRPIRKLYKGSKAAKRASRPKRKLTRRQRWAA